MLFCLNYVVKAIEIFCLIKKSCNGDVLDIGCCFVCTMWSKLLGSFALLRNPVQVTSKTLDVVLSVQCGQSYWNRLPY